MTHLVLLVIGPDRPGLVEMLSRTVVDHGGNWLDSRMARLAGQFAGIVRVSVPEASVDDFSRTIAGLRERGLDVVLHPGEQGPSPEPGRRVELELVGTDRPGIVQRIARSLAELGINVGELETELLMAPMSGENLFAARAELELPAGLDVTALRTGLEAIATDLMVDIRLDEELDEG